MPLLKIQGRYLSGNTSKQHQASLDVTTPHSISIIIDDPSSRLLFDSIDIKISSRLGNTPREISLADNQLFMTDDNDAVDELARILNKKPRTFLHTLESKLPVILVAALLTVVLVASSMLYGIPKAATIIAHEFPDFTTENFNDSILVLDQTLFQPSTLTEEKKQHIEKIFQPILDAHASNKPSLHFRSGIGPNALALPNGEIVFTDELIALADNDNELIAILFHELGHLHHKHIARRSIQNVMITLMALFIMGDINTIDLAAALPAMLLDLAYSREFEREADQYTVEQMQQANIPLTYFASIMQKLHDSTHQEAQDDDALELPPYLSTHPQMEERIRDIKSSEPSSLIQDSQP